MDSFIAVARSMFFYLKAERSCIELAMVTTWVRYRHKLPHVSLPPSLPPSLSLSLPPSISIHPSISLSLHVSLCLSMSLYVSLCLSRSLSLSPSLPPSMQRERGKKCTSKYAGTSILDNITNIYKPHYDASTHYNHMNSTQT